MSAPESQRAQAVRRRLEATLRREGATPADARAIVEQALDEYRAAVLEQERARLREGVRTMRSAYHGLPLEHHLVSRAAVLSLIGGDTEGGTE